MRGSSPPSTGLVAIIDQARDLPDAPRTTANHGGGANQSGIADHGYPHSRAAAQKERQGHFAPVVRSAPDGFAVVVSRKKTPALSLDRHCDPPQNHGLNFSILYPLVSHMPMSRAWSHRPESKAERNAQKHSFGRLPRLRNLRKTLTSRSRSPSLFFQREPLNG